MNNTKKRLIYLTLDSWDFAQCEVFSRRSINVFWRNGRKKEGREKRRPGGREEQARKGRKMKVWCQEQSAGTTLIPGGKGGPGSCQQTGPKREQRGLARKGTL